MSNTTVENDVSYIRTQYWNKMSQYKFDLFYYGFYIEKCAFIMRILKSISIGLTTLHPSNWPNYLKHKMITNDFMSIDGILTPKGEILFEGLRDNALDGDIN